MRSLALVVLLAPAIAAADATVVITLTPNGQQLEQSFGFMPGELIARINDKVTSYYQTARIPEVLKALVDTTAFSDRDLGVDYATLPGEIMFGVVGNAALDNDVTFTSGVTSGVVVNGGVIAGANLGRWGLPRWSVFGNGFYEAGSLKALDGHLGSGGLHVQVRALPGQTTGRARWIGLDVTSGVEYAHWALGAARPITFTMTVYGSNNQVRGLTITSTGTLSLVANTVTVPVEVSTGVRLFGAFAVYGGVGADVIAGSATLTAGLDGDVNLEHPAAGEAPDVGHVMITASGSQSASPLNVHALAGLQLNVPHFHIYLQVLQSPNVTGANLGLRVAL